MSKKRKVRFDVVILDSSGVSHWTLDRRQLPPRPPKYFHRITLTNQETGKSKRVYDQRFVVN